MRCTYDPETRGGNAPDGRKVKATIHWVSAAHAVDAEVRLYDRLFAVEEPGGEDWLTQLNPESLEVLRGCKLEASLADAAPGQPLAVRAHGLLLRRSVGFTPGRAGVESHRDAEGHLGADRAAAGGVGRTRPRSSASI